MSTWSSAQAYEPFMGRWSRLVAPELLRWLDLPAGLRWLDVGCGTGALCGAVLAGARPARVVGVDPSADFVRYALGRTPGIGVAVADAQALPLATGVVDVAAAGLVLNFVPDPACAVREMTRVTRRGGSVAAYVWDYAGGMKLLSAFWDAAASVDAAAPVLAEDHRFAGWDRARLSSLLDALDDVRTTALEVADSYADVGELWASLLGGTGPAPAYVATLDDVGRRALREALQARLPTGRIGLQARAWAVRGRVV